MLVEELARDRLRQTQRDVETYRLARRVRHARRQLPKPVVDLPGQIVALAGLDPTREFAPLILFRPAGFPAGRNGYPSPMDERADGR